MSKKVTEKAITPRQSIAIERLLNGGTVQGAADAAGVSRKTVYKWLSIPAFQEAINNAQAEAMARLSRALIALGGSAVLTLGETMNDHTQPAAVRVRAADIVTNRLLTMRESVEFEARLAELEKQAGINGS